jgi:hypothetical protein
MVRRHFLFLSSQTPTRKVDRGPGSDSPAALLCWPWGTVRAWSCLPSFCNGVWFEGLESAPKSLLPRCPACEKRVFLAWAIRLLALPLTPLLRRFFWSVGLPEPVGLLFPLRFSALPGGGVLRPAPPASFSGDGDFLPALSLESEFGDSDFEGPEPELPPNILFSKPP